MFCHNDKPHSLRGMSHLASKQCSIQDSGLYDQPLDSDKRIGWLTSDVSLYNTISGQQCRWLGSDFYTITLYVYPDTHKRENEICTKYYLWNIQWHYVHAYFIAKGQHGIVLMFYLTHLSLHEMADILADDISNAFSWMEIIVYRFKCHWYLFPRVQLTIRQHWFRWWLGIEQATMMTQGGDGVLFLDSYQTMSTLAGDLRPRGT